MFKWFFGGCRRGQIRYCMYSDDLYPVEYLLMDHFRLWGSCRFWICCRVEEGIVKKRPVIPEFMLFKTIQEAYKGHDSRMEKRQILRKMYLLFT